MKKATPYLDALEGVARQTQRFVRALNAWNDALPEDFSGPGEWDEKTQAEWTCLHIELAHLRRVRRLARKVAKA